MIRFRFVICLLLLFLGEKLHSQAYHPFPGNYTYNYVLYHPDDTVLHSVRVDTVYMSGQDQVSEFNQITRLNTTDNYFGDCNGGANGGFDLRNAVRYADQPGSFATKLLARPNGRYDFVNDVSQDTFRLETQIAIGTSWTVNAASGVTATLDSISQMAFLGVTDSVMHISLCNGKSLQLSQNYGAVQIIPWVPVHHHTIPAAAYPPQYELRGVDEIGLGTPRKKYLDIFRMDPGDQFQFKTTLQEGIHISFEEYCLFTIQTWDTLQNGMEGDWIEECVRFSNEFNNPDTTYTPPNIERKLFHQGFYGFLDTALEGEKDRDCYNCSVDVIEHARLVGGRTEYHLRFFRDYSGTLNPNFTGDLQNEVLQEGLGQTYFFDESPYGQDVQVYIKEMICYRTSWGEGGVCLNIPALANDIEEGWIAGEWQVWQSPGSDVLSMELPAGKVELKLIAMDGRTVYTKLRNGSQGRFETELPGLSKGIYLLQATEAGKQGRVARKKILWQ